MRPLILHFMASPVSAKRFVEPIVHALAQKGFRAELYTEDGTESDIFLSDISCPLHRLSFNVVPNPLANLIRLIRLIFVLAGRRPYVVHAHQSRSGFIPLISAFIVRVPIRIYHNHGSALWGSSGVLRTAFWLLEYINCALATEVIFVNPDLREEFVRVGIINKRKCRMIGRGSACGIDLSEFPAGLFTETARKERRRSLEVPEQSFVVAYVGRPFRRKGFHFLIKVWADSFQEKGDGRLLLAGCSRADVEAVLGEIPATIIPLGYVLELRPLYCAADVVVLPSDHEGFPYSMLEAAASQRCLVGTDIPGLKAMIEPGESGLVFRRGDEGALLHVLNKLRHDAPLRERLAQGARRRAELFDRSAILQQFVQHYQHLLQSHP